MLLDDSYSLLAFLTLLLASGATCAAAMAWFRGSSDRHFWRISSLVGVAACGTEMLRVGMVYGGEDQWTPSWDLVGASAGALTLVTPLVLGLSRLRGPLTATSSSLATRLLLTHLVITMAAGWHFQRLEAEPWDEIPTRAELLNREPVDDTELVTDQGRVIPLFRSLVQGPVEIESFHSNSVAWRTVKRVATADRKANCHGWVFAAGEYLVEAEHVDWILQDNGYCAVKEPKAGDLIIYRYDDGTPMHSGIVRLVKNDGTPVIESKWGLGGRYLHPPENPLYHGRIEYYRVPDGGDRDHSEQAGRVDRRPRTMSTSSS